MPSSTTRSSVVSQCGGGRPRPPKLAFALLLLLAACASAHPSTNVGPPLAEPPEVSTFVIPVHASLAPLLPLVEAQVPKQLAKVDAFELDREQRFGVRYKASRDAIQLTMLGTGLH